MYGWEGVCEYPRSRIWNPLELELQVGGKHLKWVLETELGASAKAGSDLNH